jgi:hypothetical protein
MNRFANIRLGNCRCVATPLLVAVAFLLGTTGASLAAEKESTNEGSQPVSPSTGDLDIQLGALHYQRAQGQMTATATPPDDAQPVMIDLHRARASEAAAVLQQLYGDRLRVAVDEHLNTLIVLPDPKIWKSVDYVLNLLDHQAERAEKGKRIQSDLQTRVVWVVDGLPGPAETEPNEQLLPPAVVEALHGLGLANPKILSQGVTTLKSPDEAFSSFSFRLPVNIRGGRIAFGGQGTVYGPRHVEGKGDWYPVSLDIKVTDPNGVNCQMSGSLMMPLDHYVVLGTTSFVPDWQAGAPGYASAFVVYLQEAPLSKQ